VSSDETVRRPVRVPVDGTALEGELTIPDGARSAVLFAHGSGSSRHSPRNRHVAGGLQAAGHATLLMDLLTEDEEEVDRVTRELRFDIDLLASRLTATVDWLDEMVGLPVALFGASTGAGAALVAAAERPRRVVGVVSRGGRPELAGDSLERVAAPVLLVVGEEDQLVLQVNRQAAERLGGRAELVVVPGAGHLFEEPGALDTVVEAAAGALGRWV
jgi:putative phosphoribosyl transferase